jgi:hypothetical protein
MGSREKRTSKVTLVVWWQCLGNELGRRKSLHFTYVIYDIAYFINRIYDDRFPLIYFSYIH